MITQNGKPAGVLNSPAEFDDLRQSKLFIESISQGLADSEKGDDLTTDKLKTERQKSLSAIEK